MAWQNKFKKRKEQKKISGELMPIAWHPRKQWNFCMPDEEKEIEPIFTENAFSASVVYNMEVLEHFGPENYTRRLDIVLLTIFLV